MKQGYDFCVFVSHLDHLLNLDDTLRIIDKPGPELFEILDKNLKANQTAITILKKGLFKNITQNLFDYTERIYFGQETCESLIHPLEEVRQALTYCNSNEFQFTLVTPYCGPKGIDKIIPVLQFLNSQEVEIEVVVNDFGILYLLNTEYTNLIPVLGRLLTKTKRDPRFSLSGYELSTRSVKNPSKVGENQKRALQMAGISPMSEYKDMLKDKGIERIGVDSVPQGYDAGLIKKSDFSYDIYWPWSYITSGRNCAVAAYTQPEKSFHPTDNSCSFQCRSFQFSFTSDKRMYYSVQRGNAVWMDSEALHEELFKIDFDRLVYIPYIPV